MRNWRLTSVAPYNLGLLFAQVLRDYHGNSTLPGISNAWEQNLRAFLSAATPSGHQAAVEPQVAEPQEAVLVAEAPAETPKRAPKTPRLAALDLLRSINHALSSVDLPLSRFAEGPWAPGQHAMLTIACDEGPDNCAAMWWLTHHRRLRVVWMRDPPHREHNDVTLAIKHSGLWGSVLDMCLVWNLGYGPFNSGAWYKSMLEGASDMLHNLQPSDGLTVWLGPHLATESNQSGMPLDLEPVLTKGPRVSLSRWFSFYDATSHHWKFWYTKLAILLFIAVQAGHVTNAKDFPLLVADLQGPAALQGATTAAGPLCQEEAEGPESKHAAVDPLRTEAVAEPPCDKQAAIHSAVAGAATRDSHVPPQGHVGKPKQKAAPAATRKAGKSSEESTALDSLRNLRAKCTNTMHAAAVVLANEETRSTAAMLLAVIGPIRTAHGNHIKQLREGPDRAASLYAAWANGSWMPEVYSCTAVLHDQAALADCGLLVEGDAACSCAPGGSGPSAGTPSAPASSSAHSSRTSQRAPEDAVVLGQDIAAAKLDRLVFNIVKFRSQSMMWHSDGLPGLLAGLLHSNVECRIAVLQKLKDLWQVFKAVKAAEPKPPFLQKALARSPFSTFLVQLVCHALESSSFHEVPGEIASWLRSVFGSFGTTKLIEDSFNRLRDHESRDAKGPTMRCAKRWDIVVRSSLLGDNQRHELNPKKETVSAKRISRGLFHAPAAAESDRLTNFASICQRQTWPSPSPQTAVHIQADWGLLLKLYKHSPENPTWRSATQGWRSCLLLPGELYQRVADGRVFRSFGQLGAAALGWPMQQLPPDGDSSKKWTYDNNKPEWLCMLQWEEFQAIPAAATSPLACIARGGRAPCVASLQLSEPCSPLLYAARKGFPGVPAADLARLCTEMKVPRAHPTLCEQLVALISRVLGLGEEEALELLDLRCQHEAQQTSSAPVSVDTEVLHEVLGADKKEHDEGAADAARAVQQRQALRAQIKACRANVRAKAGRTGTAAASSSAASGSRAPGGPSIAAPPGTYWRAPAVDTEWAAGDVLALMPPTAAIRVRRDVAQGRWVLAYKDIGTKSYSWGLWGGESNVVRLLACKAWELHETATDEPCTGSACPVHGLFPTENPEPAAVAREGVAEPPAVEAAAVHIEQASAAAGAAGTGSKQQPLAAGVTAKGASKGPGRGRGRGRGQASAAAGAAGPGSNQQPLAAGVAAKGASRGPGRGRGQGRGRGRGRPVEPEARAPKVSSREAAASPDGPARKKQRVAAGRPAAGTQSSQQPAAAARAAKAAGVPAAEAAASAASQAAGPPGALLAQAGKKGTRPCAQTRPRSSSSSSDSTNSSSEGSGST